MANVYHGLTMSYGVNNVGFNIELYFLRAFKPLYINNSYLDLMLFLKIISLVEELNFHFM